MNGRATLEALHLAGAQVVLLDGEPVVRRARHASLELIAQARAEKVAIAAHLEAELAPLLAELADVADRWERGVRYLGATRRQRAPAVQRRFEELADRAGELVDQIEAIAPGTADELLARIFAADESQDEAGEGAS